MEPIGNSLKKMLASVRWKSRLDEIRIRESWEEIMGKTIAKYTHHLTFNNGELIIYTQIAPLKHELKMAQEAIIQNINQHFEEKVVKSIIIK
jgi:predicted nucleic acid-binding Zn ribbon protein